jgi:hypothetical protein
VARWTLIFDAARLALNEKEAPPVREGL